MWIDMMWQRRIIIDDHDDEHDHDNDFNHNHDHDHNHDHGHDHDHDYDYDHPWSWSWTGSWLQWLVLYSHGQKPCDPLPQVRLAESQNLHIFTLHKKILLIIGF